MAKTNKTSKAVFFGQMTVACKYAAAQLLASGELADDVAEFIWAQISGIEMPGDSKGRWEQYTTAISRNMYVENTVNSKWHNMGEGAFDTAQAMILTYWAQAA